LREALKLQAARMQELRSDVVQSVYFEKLVEVFKFTFEMCAVLPPLSINLPQLQSPNNIFQKSIFAIDQEFGEILSTQESQVDVH